MELKGIFFGAKKIMKYMHLRNLQKVHDKILTMKTAGF